MKSTLFLCPRMEKIHLFWENVNEFTTNIQIMYYLSLFSVWDQIKQTKYFQMFNALPCLRMIFFQVSP